MDESRVYTPGLLVSVRSTAEALEVLAGGAALIDVKEPNNGALGRADDEVIADVVRTVAGRCPVSAALGELIDHGRPIPAADLAFVKWGLAGCGRVADWAERLPRAGGRAVLVAYADWQCAGAPAVEAVVAEAVRRRGVLLIDTHCKEPATTGGRRPTLLDWRPLPWLIELCRGCRAGGVRVALAGSLGPAEIAELAPARPDWFAVRGAACAGDRGGQVEAARVRELLRIMQTPASRAG